MNNCPECKLEVVYIGFGVAGGGLYKCFYCQMCNVSYALIRSTAALTATVRLDTFIEDQETETKYLEPFESVLDKLDKAY